MLGGSLVDSVYMEEGRKRGLALLVFSLMITESGLRRK